MMFECWIGEDFHWPNEEVAIMMLFGYVLGLHGGFVIL